jgi:hypothetical protein
MEVTGNFTDFYGTSMLPALRTVIDRGYKSRPPQYPQVFNILSSTRSLEQFSQVSGVSRFALIPEGEPVRRDMAVPGFKSSFVHTRYGLAVPVTIDVVEDDKWDLIGNTHKDMGWSCAETQELDAVSTFNNGFSGSFLGPDGVALFSASHPLYKAGGVQSNLMTAADLDMLSFQLALTQFELQKRPSGEFIHEAPSKLIVHPSNRFIAYALTKSGDDPTTADRSVNPLKGAEDGIPTPFVWRYLTTPNAWFLSATPQQTGLVWFWRKRPYTKSWTDDDTEVGVTGMRYKKSHGWNNYIGLIGNQGQ